MQVPFRTDDGKFLCELDISNMPHLDASFMYSGKHFKIIQITETSLKNAKDKTYECIVRSMSKKEFQT